MQNMQCKMQNREDGIRRLHFEFCISCFAFCILPFFRGSLAGMFF